MGFMNSLPLFLGEQQLPLILQKWKEVQEDQGLPQTCVVSSHAGYVFWLPATQCLLREPGHNLALISGSQEDVKAPGGEHTGPWRVEERVQVPQSGHSV